MWKSIVRNKGFWVGILLSCAGLYVALKGVRLDQLGSELSAVPWTLAFLVGGVSLIATGIRAYRWMVAVESFSEVSFKNVLSAFMAGMFGLNVIPARVGEYLRVFVLGKNSSLSQSSVLATVVFERVMDGLTILTIFAAAIMLRPAADSAHLLGSVRKEYLLLIPALFVGSLGTLFAIARHPQTMMNGVGTFSRHLGRFGARLPGMVGRFSNGLVIFSDMGRLVRYTVWSFVSWLAVSGYYYVNFRLLDIPLGMASSVVVMSVIVVGVMIPAAPGFVGTYHAFCKMALVAFGVDEARALSFAVVTHAVPYVLHTVLGFVCVLREHVRLADLSA